MKRLNFGGFGKPKDGGRSSEGKPSKWIQRGTQPQYDTFDGDLPFFDLTEDDDDEEEDFLFKAGKESLLIARGNIQVVKGREKTGKSAFGIALIVSALCGGFLGLEPTKDDLTILWIDTEQGRKTLRKRAEAAFQMAQQEICHDRLKILQLKKVQKNKRLDAVRKAAEKVKPDFIFLDGAVDLCEDFNDNKNSAGVVDALMELTEDINCAILCVIHANKKDDEARGHIGTILQQKGTEVFKMTKDGGTAIVELSESRFADIPPVMFRFADGFMLEAVDASAKEEGKKKECYDMFKPLFDGVSSYRYTALVKALASREDISESKAKKEVTQAFGLDVLFKDKDGRYSFIMPDTDEQQEIDDDYL